MGRRKRESPLEVAMQWIAKKNDSPGFQIDRFKDKGMLIVKPSPSQAPPPPTKFWEYIGIAYKSVYLSICQSGNLCC